MQQLSHQSLFFKMLAYFCLLISIKDRRNNSEYAFFHFKKGKNINSNKWKNYAVHGDTMNDQMCQMLCIVLCWEFVTE